MSLLRRILSRLFHFVTTPIRLFRQRTIVQLMVSHVAVVLTTFLLLNIIVVAVIVGWLPGRELIGLEEASQDFFLGERARGHATWLGTSDVISEDRPLDTPGARAELNRLLTMIVESDVPGYRNQEAAKPASSGFVAFGMPRDALITDPTGVILSTTEPSLGEVGARVSSIDSTAVRDAIGMSLRLGGSSDDWSGVAYSVSVSGDITGAAAPIFNPDGTIAAYLVIQGHPIPEIFSQQRAEILKETALSVLRTSWVYIIPAILVAVPFAYWQSRSTSRRIERLATLADAFADGDLHTRIKVSRHDEIGRLAERFNEMGIRVEEDARTRRAFLSNVSHELRTPVAIIHGTIERLQEDRLESAEEARQAINLVSLETHNLTRLIDDLSTLGRLEEAKLRLELQSIDVYAIVDKAVDGLKELAWSQRKVSIENIVPPDLPRAFGDPGRLLQITHNLLFNALRHTPEGGLVVVQAATSGDTMEISVSDTGIGISPENQEHVFDRYYQVERHERSREGSGLGLHIVQQLVEAQGGAISVESTVGTGTTFRFTLPLSSKPQGRPAQNGKDEEVV